jgi:hypothetical protein
LHRPRGGEKKEEEEKTCKITYNTGDSLVVTDPTTSPALFSLTKGEQTGSRIFLKKKGAPQKSKHDHVRSYKTLSYAQSMPNMEGRAPRKWDTKPRKWDVPKGCGRM